MTALDQVRGWFIAPPPPASTTPTGWSAPPPDAPSTAAANRNRLAESDPLASAARTSPPADPAARSSNVSPPPDPSAPRAHPSAPRAHTSPPADPPSPRARVSPPADAPEARVSSPGDRSAPPAQVSPPGDRPAPSGRGFADGRRAPSSRGSLPDDPLAPAALVASPAGPLDGVPLAPTSPPGRSRGGKRRTRPTPTPVAADEGGSVVDGAPRSPAARGGWQPPVAGEWMTVPEAAGSVAVTSAAVLGRAGEVEPVAAALALALRRETRAKAATVAVAGEMPPEVEQRSAAAAARRLGARLEAHGLEAHVRGRLAWVRLEPGDPQFATTARRVALVAAPAVVAVTAARTAAVDEALGEQDLLVVVTSDPEGPLAQLAADGVAGAPVVGVRPLGRGPARALARAGVRPARSLRHLLATAPEATRCHGE
jgi:hypothetical protein